MYTVRAFAVVAAVVGLFQGAPRSLASEGATAGTKIIRIGLTESLCRDADPKVLMVSIPPFRALAKSCTGLDCDLAYGGDAYSLADRLARGQLELGIFQGIEFAWLRQKHPELRPLTTVVNGTPYLRAFLVMPAARRGARPGDLKGRSLAISRYSLDDCYQFLGKLCREQGLSPAQVLSKISQPPDAEDALDQVVDGTIDATIVEEVSLDCYRRRKPGRFRQLEIVQRSERFPATVVAYRAGSLNEDILRVFRHGMSRAHLARLGPQFMTWWRITGFQEVPPGYQEMLDEIVKAYPTPTGEFQVLTLRSLLDQADRLFGQQWSSFRRDR